MKNTVKFVKSQALLVLITFVIAGIGLYVFMPKFKEYQEIKKEIEAQNQRITVLTRKLNDLSSLSEKELEDNVDLSLKSVPAEKDFYVVVKNIKNIFGQEGILLSTFQFTVGEISTQSAKKRRLTCRNFSACHCHFRDRWIKQREQFPGWKILCLYSRLNLLKLTSEYSSSSGQLGNYTGSMNLKSYFALLPKTLGAIDKELPKISSPQKKQLEELSAYEYYSTEEEFPTEGIAVGRENPFPVY